VLFHVAHNVFKVFAMRADDHVDVAGHDAPAIDFQSFFSLAMLPAIDHDVPVFIADKKVYPVYYGKTYKVKFILVVEFIFGAHYNLNVRQETVISKTDKRGGYLSAGHECCRAQAGADTRA
jgi:hypothetical protein